MNFGLTGNFGTYTFEELSSNDLEVVSGGSGGYPGIPGLPPSQWPNYPAVQQLRLMPRIDLTYVIMSTSGLPQNVAAQIAGQIMYA